MSVSSHMAFESGSIEVPDQFDSCGDTYPYVIADLDKIAERLGIEKPSRFDYEDPEFYEEIMGDEIPPNVQERLDKQEEWHDASVGLTTFSKLFEYIRDNGEEIKFEKNVELRAVRYDLEAFMLMLEKAAQQNDRFRIEADV